MSKALEIWIREKEKQEKFNEYLKEKYIFSCLVEERLKHVTLPKATLTEEDEKILRCYDEETRVRFASAILRSRQADIKRAARAEIAAQINAERQGRSNNNNNDRTKTKR